MVLEKIVIYKFDTEEIVGTCSDCQGNVYNVPEYRGRFVLSMGNENLFNLG
jgi:hypothetical protein